MNKIYKVLWNARLGCWQAVSELAKSHSSSSQTSSTQPSTHSNFIGKIRGMVLFTIALLPLSIHAATQNNTLPTGGTINSGSANISQSDNTLNINQNSQNLSANWNTFNIGQDATVNFNQPNHSSTAINHVLDSNASQIMGRLNANGQVFLLNPNGVVFSKTAQVNVGGLVASTLNLSDTDIQNGKFTLKGDANSTVSIENHGTIHTANGGTVALIAPNVKNTGSITTPDGTTHLTSASQVTLALQDGSLTQYQVDQGVLQGLVDNGGAIIADNGAVYLTAKAKDSLSKAVVNHSGIIEANRLSQNAKGEIILLGDMAVGETHVSGTITAEGKNGQDGGFIETSAAKVNIADGVQVSTLSDSGKTGEWLIDPTDFSINSGNALASGNGIGATTLASSLATSNVTLLTSTTGNQKGDINVNADVTWGSATSLTLNAQNDININANITATNNSGKLNLIYGQNTANTSANYYINSGAKINLKAGQNFSTKKGTAATINYQVITALGAQGSTTSQDLQGINGNLSGNYVLGADIDASSTGLWNGYTGFDPIGFYNTNLSPMDSSQQAFRGRFDGLGHAINGLSIESMYQGIGLFAITHQDALIQNVGLNNISYSGYGNTGGIVGINLGTINNVYVNTGLVTGNTEHYGGLVGWNFNSGNILNSYANVTVKGKYSSNNYIGGLVGYSDGVVSSSFATGTVTGNNYVGGLIGGISGQINNSYATGTITGNQYVGGLVGFNGGNVDKNYSSGSVAGNAYVGGLVGGGNGTTTNSFWNTSTSGRTSSAGGVGKTTAELQQVSTFAGWDIDAQGGTGKTWRIYEGSTTPLLRSFLKSSIKTVGSTNFTDQIYSGLVYSGTLASGLIYKTSSKNVGVYSLNDGSIILSDGLSHTQFGEDVIYQGLSGPSSFNITPKVLTITGMAAANKVYDGNTSATLSGGTLSGLVSGETLILNGVTGTFGDKNAGTGKTVTVTGTTLGNGSNGGLAANYTISNPVGLTAAITARTLNVAALGQNKVYDGTTAAQLILTDNRLAGDALSISGTGSFADKNAGTGKTISVTGLNIAGADAGNYVLADTTAQASADIAKAKATVTANSKATTYNGANQGVSGFTANGLVGGETASVLTGVTASASGKDAGSYDNIATGTDKNYDLSFVAGSLDIAKAKATVTANSKATTYNGANQSVSGFTASGLVGGETASVLTDVTASVSGKDAGSYDNIATGTDKNYDLSFVAGSLDIAKAKATVTANSKATTYNGANQSVSGFTANGLVGGETASVLTDVTASVSGKDAGSYDNIATGTDKNYDLTFVDGALNIAKAKATVTANSKATTYNGANQSVSGFTASGLVGGETASVLTDVTASVSGKDAGSYDNIATGTDKNYDLTFVDGALNIAKAKATVTANSKATTYNGANQSVSGFTASGLVGGETASVLTDVTASVSGKDAGSYDNIATGTDKNYDLSFVAGSLDIAKAKATVTANSKATTYNGANQSVSGFTANGLVGGETASVLTDVTASVSGKDAGSYDNIATGTDKNYDLSFVAGSLDIAKAKATVTANSKATTYNGANQGVSGFTANGLVGGETASVLTGVTASASGKDAGSYDNIATGTDKNYDLSFVAGSLDIAKAKATVTANSKATTYNGANQSVSGFTANGLVGGETASVLTDVTASVSGKDAGSYDNIATGTDKNYDLTFVDGALNIAKAKATVTANSKATTYNGANQSVSGFTASGLVGGETESVLTDVTASVSGKDAGSYDNIATGTDKNYDLSFVAGSLDIAKAKATVTANSKATTYNGANQSVSGFTANGLVGGETASVLTDVTASVSGKDAGSYDNIATGTDKNYDLSFVAGSLDIAKAKATVTANSKATTYNGANQGVSGFTANGLVGGETASVLTGVTASASGKDAGSYDNIATGTDKNYDLSFVAGSLDIAKAKATVTANSKATTYNGANQSVSGFTASGLVGGETESVLTDVTASVSGKDAGSYDNIATGTDKNYDLSFVAGSLDIAKAKATVTANSKATTYNGANQSVSGFTANGLVGGETASVLTDVTASVSGKDAGSYDNIATGTDKNYDLSFVAGSLDIAKAKATVTANSKATTYNGANQGVSGFTANGLVGGETASVLTGVTASASGKDAGSYDNIATGTDKNYDLSFVAGSLDIAKAKATVTANSKATTYNGANQSVSGFTANGLVGGETASVLTDVTASVSGKDAGSYDNIATGTDKNYDLSFVAGSLDIAKAKATVTANSKATTYNGANQGVSGFTASGLVGGETASVLTGVTASASGKDAGSYDNIATGTDKNYDLSFVAGSLDIAKAKATVTANSKATTYNGANQSVSGFTASGLVGGETASVLTDVTASVSGKDTGSYDNIATGTDKNYDLTFVSGALDIAKAQIDHVTGILANNKFYDGNTSALLNTGHAEFIGIYAGDELNIATATGVFSDNTIGKEKIVNISNLSLGGGDAANYQLMNTTASTKADISILTPPVNPPADIPMLTPAGYLQAIHFRLNQDQASNEPETKENRIVNVFNSGIVNVVDGAINMTGITMLAGKH